MEVAIRPLIPSLLALFSACEGSIGRDAEVTTLVVNAFEAARPPGPAGTEVLGKGVWFRTSVIDGLCLQENTLGIRDQPGRSRQTTTNRSGRIAPRVSSQSEWTTSTEKGFCIYLGDDMSMTPGGVTKVGDAYVINVTYEMAQPGPWWKCVSPTQRNGSVRVLEAEDGTLSIEGQVGLDPGACPSPLPSDGRTRTAAKRPKGKAPSAPTKADAKAAMKRLDDALWAHDLPAALDATACYNLFEKKPFGACSVGEVVNVGPITRGELRMADGPPWTMNALKSLDRIGPITADRQDKTLFHVEMKPKSGKRPARTAALQWTDGSWKVVGVVQREGEGLTSIEYVNNLDRKETREIFERRMKGEAIGADGHPLKPEVQ